MKLLVAQGPNVVCMVDKATGDIPLHYACYGNSPQDNENLKAVLLDNGYQIIIEGFMHMNEAGREYIVDYPGDKRKAIAVLQSVSMEINCLFLHVFENPAICMASTGP